MLTLHRLFVKTAIVYLILGTALGGFMLANKGWFRINMPHHFVTIHNHMISVGFVMMMIMGVAYWMFPRPSGVPLREVGREPMAWANYFLLNLGLILRFVFEPFADWQPAGNLLIISSLLQMLGISMFVVSIWKRIRFPAGK
ncbi:MAG: hypothetical protein HY644_15335 [Acidobacteria bacterium]|nr:hypothetical protein [Acidobacteriota bacterium]